MTEDAPFTAAMARALTDARAGENPLVLFLRLQAFPRLRAEAEAAHSKALIACKDALQARAVQAHLEGLGYEVTPLSLTGNANDLEVSW